MQVEASVHMTQFSEHERHFPSIKYLPGRHKIQFVALTLHEKHILSQGIHESFLRTVPGKQSVQTVGVLESQAAHRFVL